MSSQSDSSSSPRGTRDPDVLVAPEQWQRSVSKGENLLRMIADPTRPCHIPRSTLTLQHLHDRFPQSSDMGPAGALSRTNAAYLPVEYPGEDREDFSGYYLNVKEINEHGTSRIFFWGQVGPRVLLLEDIRWKNKAQLADYSNHMSEICLAAYSSRFSMNSLQYVYAKQVENVMTRDMLDHLHRLISPEQGFQLDLGIRVWRYGTPQYLALLGTKVGRTVAYILLGAVGQGQLRISQILTWIDGPRSMNRWMRFDFEPIPQSGEPMPRQSIPRHSTSQSPREGNIEGAARAQQMPQTTALAPSELSGTPEGFWGNVQNLENPVPGSSPEEGFGEEGITLPYSEVETWRDSVRHAQASPHDVPPSSLSAPVVPVPLPTNPSRVRRHTLQSDFVRIPAFDGNQDTPGDIQGRVSSPPSHSFRRSVSSPPSHSSRRSRASFRYPSPIFPCMSYPMDEPEFPPLPPPAISIHEQVPTDVSQETKEASTRPMAPSDLLFRGRESAQQPVAEEPPVQTPIPLRLERWLAEHGWQPKGPPTREELQERDALRSVYQMELRMRTNPSPSPSASGQQAPLPMSTESSHGSSESLPMPWLTETVRRRPSPEAPTPFMLTRPEPREPQQAEVRRRAPTPFTLTRPESRAPRDSPDPADEIQFFPTLGLSEVLVLGSSEPATPGPAATAAEPVVEAANEPVTKPAAEAVTDPATDPATEAVNEPAAEATNAEASETDNATDNAATVAPVPATTATATANPEDDLEAQERGQPEGRWEAIVRLLKLIFQCLVDMFWVLIRGSGNGQTGRT